MKPIVPTAVVFAYGDVGIRCIEVLLSQQVDVRLVVTHEDDPAEARWYDSVAELAAEHLLPCIAPESPNEPELLRRVAGLSCDFLFSFYYRKMLSPALLSCARRGAFNMHGSLLPRFRGRAPVNWAILRGAHETGATLHCMVARADAGDIVDQLPVPILIDDDALAVFRKVTVAAEIVLSRSLPRLVDGSAPRIPQRAGEGEYCGRRRPEDGRIDWLRPAREIHDLVRAVAPPFPGAFTEFLGERWNIARTALLADREPKRRQSAWLHARDGQCIVTCADGGQLRLLSACSATGSAGLETLVSRLERSPIALA
jgi:methionyl-tRNA formyltransferase